MTTTLAMTTLTAPPTPGAPGPRAVAAPTTDAFRQEHHT